MRNAWKKIERWGWIRFSILLWTAACSQGVDSGFESGWTDGAERVWIGPEYWANPMQDWRLANGRIENIVAGGDRNVFLLTRELGAAPGDFRTSVELGRLEEDTDAVALEEGFSGFRVGIRGQFDDYRDSAVRGDGLNVGLLTDGRLFIGRLEADAARVPTPFSERWMKAVISQTIFANVATLPRGTLSGAVTPTLKVMAPGEYAEGELRVQDHDSNGWPQSGRNKALRAMRKGFAIHIAGDQHLGSTIQYGIDTFRDAGWALCVPSVANIWPRRWFPPEPGGNHEEGTPRNTGDYLDGFGNKMTVHAVSNPTANGIEPTAIHHRAPGYGIVTLDRDTREITFANWPRWVDPSEPDATPYPGWPITFDQLANGFPAEGGVSTRSRPRLMKP